MLIIYNNIAKIVNNILCIRSKKLKEEMNNKLLEINKEVYRLRNNLDNKIQEGNSNSIIFKILIQDNHLQPHLKKKEQERILALNILINLKSEFWS
jgi:hypothetical protein